MDKLCVEIPMQYHFFVGLIIFVAEYVLGKTKFGSTFGMLETLFKEKICNK